MPEPLKLATETTFKRFDVDCDGQLTIDELHQMVTETANAFGLEAAPKHVYSARRTCGAPPDTRPSIGWHARLPYCWRPLRPLRLAPAAAAPPPLPPLPSLPLLMLLPLSAGRTWRTLWS